MRFLQKSLGLPQNSQKPLLKCKKLVINIRKSDLCLFLHKLSCKMVEKSMRFEKSYGNWLPDGPNSVRFYLSVRYGMYAVRMSVPGDLFSCFSGLSH